MIKIALIVACLIPSIASAASFDCDTAKSSIEKAVCADSALSALDSDISASYNDAMKRLSPKGQTILKDGQRQWLRFVRDRCMNLTSLKDVDFCLTSQYKDRLKDLSQAAMSIGPYMFSRSDYFSASNHDESGRPFEIHAGAPRIDAPLSPMTERWNSEMSKQAKSAIGRGCDGQWGDEYFNYDRVYASAKAISIRTTGWEYCHGTPNGHGGTSSTTDITQPRFRPLETSDLFNPASAWEDYLTQRSYEVFERKAEGTEIDRDRVEDAATEIRNWTLTQDGLLITFAPYTVLSYAFGTTEVIISWRDLRSFLAPNAPISPRP